MTPRGPLPPRAELYGATVPLRRRRTDEDRCPRASVRPRAAPGVPRPRGPTGAAAVWGPCAYTEGVGVRGE